ncbi:DUF1289 domain-containing protein [Roseicyclus sp. F158]|uniref:DUF1289 domain-containing protein n=1 Tax=Tropicimonas omnivorans TaxID=3075590 RepID=A0ABU3DME0_9RHOB|nr:DUF1289 domain-containing protein [Roseicyclus sp. F158]MDT0684689.1 DUF1289 domain-containing protein [Roseicyclus sp. F158]
MSDDVWTRDEPQSPCIKICQIHPQERICIGCYRTQMEIGLWKRMSAEERREVLAELPGRASRVAPRRRGGRAARKGFVPPDRKD